MRKSFLCCAFTGYLLWYILPRQPVFERLLSPLVCLADGHDGVWNLFEEIGSTAIRQEISSTTLKSIQNESLTTSIFLKKAYVISDQSAVESAMKQKGIRLKISGASVEIGKRTSDATTSLCTTNGQLTT